MTQKWGNRVINPVLLCKSSIWKDMLWKKSWMKLVYVSINEAVIKGINYQDSAFFSFSFIQFF